MNSKHDDTAYRVNTWSLADKQPRLFAARYAMEQAATLQDVADEVADPQHQYMFGFNLILSDTSAAAVLEIDAEHRGFRWDTSPLHSGLIWGFSQAVAAGERITWEELKQIASFDGANAQPDFWTAQIIAFDPEQLKLDVFFRTTDVDLPTDPDFIRVPIDFGESEGTQPDTTPPPGGASVPEPSTGILVTFGGLGILSFWKRTRG